MSSYREKEFIIFRLSSGTSRLQNTQLGITIWAGIGTAGSARTYHRIGPDTILAPKLDEPSWIIRVVWLKVVHGTTSATHSDCGAGRGGSSSTSGRGHSNAIDILHYIDLVHGRRKSYNFNGTERDYLNLFHRGNLI